MGKLIFGVASLGLGIFSLFSGIILNVMFGGGIIPGNTTVRTLLWLAKNGPIWLIILPLLSIILGVWGLVKGIKQKNNKLIILSALGMGLSAIHLAWGFLFSPAWIRLFALAPFISPGYI